jgi:hypothetical protein
MRRTVKRKSLPFRLLPVFILLSQFTISTDAQVVRPGAGEPPAPLFQSDETLYLTLSMDMKTVFSNRKEEEKHPAVISYTDHAGTKITIPMMVNLRGNFRKDPNNCDFPPLRFDFSKTTVKNTIFEGQDKVKLVTHCRSRLQLYEQNVLKEYLAYKLYNLLTEESYLVRLVHMTYADDKGELDTIDKIAFLLEPTGQMAARNGCEKLKVSNIHQTKTNQYKTTVMALFQYLIGNTDWSVWAQHNIVLLKEDTSVVPIVVPYDFDWSGLVNAPYAVPAEFLPIETVRTRLYRGFCVSNTVLQPALDEFRQRKDEIYQTCNNIPFLSDKELKKILKYIDDFFSIIENPKKVESVFQHKCRTVDQDAESQAKEM